MPMLMYQSFLPMSSVSVIFFKITYLHLKFCSVNFESNPIYTSLLADWIKNLSPQKNIELEANEK